MSFLRTRKKTWRGVVAALTAMVVLGVTAGCAELEDLIAEVPQDTSAGGESRTLLEQLTLTSGEPASRYDRKRFSHWRKAGANCDVRDTVLQRDGTDIKLDGCNVIGGSWTSVYDGLTFTDPLKVDIDHMVPLSNAWRSGADEWDDAQRSEFANDLVRPQLFAVSAKSNRTKGDKDPSQWKPPSQSYWCTYAQDWITVKHHWKLSVTTEEKDALVEMLQTCPGSTKS